MRPTNEWDAHTEQRLIELFRGERTLEEMARELSLPPDMIEERLSELLTDPDEPDDPLRHL